MGEWERPPKLREDLIVAEQESDGQKIYVLKDPITFRYFRLREPEYFLVRQFDGAADSEAIAQRFRDKFNLNVTADAVEKFAQRIDELYFFEGPRAEYETSSGRYLRQTRRSLFSKILFIKLKAFNPDKMLNVLLPPLRFLFHPISLTLMIAFILAGFAVYSANFESFKFEPRELYSVGSIIIVLLSVTIIILLHEFAHALTCKYLGGQVREMGFLLLYFQICFYTNLSDSWMFRRKSQRLAVIWAGIFFQMALFAVAVFGWRAMVVGTGISHFFWISANVCLLTLLFNFNPLIKLDGYYFLSEWLGIPNLRSKSFAFLRYVVKRTLGLYQSSTQATRREKRVYVMYTLMAGAYSILLIVVVAAIVYRFLVGLLGGAGFILFLILLALIFKGPVVQTIRFVGSREVMKALGTRPRNLIVGGIVIVTLIIVIFIIPFPRNVGGDVIVRPVAEYTITLFSGQGLLEAKLRLGGVARQFNTEHIQLSTGDLSVLRLTPLVQEGDDIRKGDTLAAIASTQVSSNLQAARAELQRLNGELALAQSPPKPEEIATAQAAVAAARASVDQLEKDNDRNKSLYEKNLISGQEVEHGQSLLDVARSNLEETEAKLQLLKSPPKPEEIGILKSKIATQEANISLLMSQAAAQVITSPIDGIVTALYRNNLLFRISDMSKIEVSIPITDNYLEYVEPDADVRIKVRTYSDHVFEGHVTHIANSADDASYNDNRARFSVYGVVDNTSDMLRDGMSGYAKISCGKASLFTIFMDRVKSFIRVEFWSWW
jgi:putative peptide zinc metalloprotease protein